MKTLDVSPSPAEMMLASIPDLQPARCLIVLVPEFGLDTVIVARKIWELAHALESRVKFLGLSKDAAHEPSLRRQLVTLSAMVEDENISTELKVEIGNNWLNAVKSAWRKGDVIACFSEPRSGLTRRPLNQILESNLNATVYVLSGLCGQKARLRSTWRPEAVAWAGSIGIIFGFLWMQIKITQFSQDWTHTVLLYISLFAEAGAIWLWNSLAC